METADEEKGSLELVHSIPDESKNLDVSRPRVAISDAARVNWTAKTAKLAKSITKNIGSEIHHSKIEPAHDVRNMRTGTNLQGAPFAANLASLAVLAVGMS